MSVLAGIFGEVGTWAQVVLGVGLLIFIHELGHFLVAKWAGVKVLAFSLGFGPVLAGFRRGDTHYRLSLIPLGGYVKMSGEVERPEGGFAPDDYPSKPVGVRALIIAAGVIMNALLGFALFAVALLVGVPLTPATVGAAVPGGPAWKAGLLPGDRILRANGRELLDFTDLRMAAAAGEPLDLEVERDGRTLRLSVVPEKKEGDPAPAIGVYPTQGNTLKVEEGSPAARAGFRTGDVVAAVEGVPCRLDDLRVDPVVQQVLLPRSGPLRVAVERDGAMLPLVLEPVESTPKIGILPLRTTVEAVRPGGPAEEAGWKAGDRPVAVEGREIGGWFAFLEEAMRNPGAAESVRVARDGEVRALPLPPGPARRVGLLRDLHFAGSPSKAAVEVLPGSPAAAAGLPGGARITAVDGAKVADYDQVLARMAQRRAKEEDGGEADPLRIDWEADHPDGRVLRGTAEIRPAPHPIYVGGRLWEGVSTEGGEVVMRRTSPGELLSAAGDRCLAVVGQIGVTLRGIFGGSLDKSAVGGPILIAQVARASTESGFASFLWLLAALSINLMVLNILPIPLLDGGQLVLLGVEAVIRRPPSEAVVGIAQMAGLVLLLGLMLLVTYNDIARILGG